MAASAAAAAAANGGGSGRRLGLRASTLGQRRTAAAAGVVGGAAPSGSRRRGRPGRPRRVPDPGGAPDRARPAARPAAAAAEEEAEEAGGDEDGDGMHVFDGGEVKGDRPPSSSSSPSSPPPTPPPPPPPVATHPGEAELMRRAEEWMLKFRTVPNIKTLVGWAREIGLGRREAKRVRRAIPFVSSNVGDGRKYGGKKRQRQLGLTFRSVHWGSADYGFMQIYGKRYGSFFLGVNSASRKIYVEPVADKTSQTTARCLINMLRTPGFEQITR